MIYYTSEDYKKVKHEAGTSASTATMIESISVQSKRSWNITTCKVEACRSSTDHTEGKINEQN